MKKIFILFLLIIVGKITIAQQNDNPMKSALDTIVHKMMSNYMKAGTRVGISVGINYRGHSYTYNYGETSPGSGILPSNTSIYKIGSITKTFTGLLIAHAIKEGKISLNDDIRKFLPSNFPNLQYPNGSPVKIAYLLAHTAQFPNSFGEELTTTSFITKLHQIKLDSLKAFRYEYSNVGYQLLGLILENVYHKSYAELVKDYITHPLGMRNTKLTYTATKNRLLLNGYGATKELVKPPSVALPAAGGLYSSVSDMLKYLAEQCKERSSAVKLSHTLIFGDVDKEAYGFQWSIGKTWNWDQYVRTDGGINGFRSFCVMYPLREISLVILTNQKDDSAGVELYKAVNGIYNVLKKQ